MNIFESAGNRKPSSNKFDLSHEVKLSCNMGKLIPILLQEILPSDNFSVKSEIMVRLAPMLAPLMHRVDVYTHYFFVPNRIVYDDWEDFITGGRDGTLEPTLPYLQINSNNADQFTVGDLSDYFGIPPTGTAPLPVGTHHVSALPFRAYYEIYKEYFHDRNLEEPYEYDKGSGLTSEVDLDALSILRTRAWEKDYFTSAFTDTQRGGEAQIPLGNIEPNYKDVSLVVDNTGGVPPSDGALAHQGGFLEAGDTPITAAIHNLDTMNVDATTINELRKANKLQEWLEISQRAGSRYIENIKGFWGQKSSDARLQRPEYLGGGKSPVVISEVLNTAGQTEHTANPGDAERLPVGDMAGHGISVGQNNNFSRKFEEHGYVIGIMSVLPRTAYHQGVHRHFTRTTKWDYAVPVFAHLGEQEVLNKELFWDWDDLGNENDDIFGYQQRFAEYKYAQSTIHGEFHTTLNYWTMVRDFDTLPTLSPGFIRSDPTFDIFAVTDEEVHHLYVQIYHKISAIRALPYFSIPSL